MTESVRIARVRAEERLDDPAERLRVVEYLRAGSPILISTALREDKLDPARGKVVGASYRTDGAWVWSDALTYYVRVHGVAPEPALLARIRAHDYVCPTPDDDAQDVALRELYASF